MKVKGVQYDDNAVFIHSWHILQNLFFVSVWFAEERFGMTRKWVNNNKILIFVVNYPLNMVYIYVTTIEFILTAFFNILKWANVCHEGFTLLFALVSSMSITTAYL